MTPAPPAPPSAPAVGRFIEPVNIFAMLGPWLAVIGVVGCVTAVAVIAKKREP